MSYWRLMKAVERGITLAKVFNLREGFTRADDVLPKRMAISGRVAEGKMLLADGDRVDVFELLGGG